MCLSRCCLGDNGAAALASGLAGSSSVRELDVLHNEIGDDGAAALATALMRNENLTKLDLACNAIGDAGAAALGGALAHNGSLLHLVLRGNRIRAAGAEALAGGLARNGSLRRLAIDGEIGVDGLQSLCRGLERNQALSDFSFLPAPVPDKAAIEVLLGVLQCNTSLCEMFYVNYNMDIKAALASNRLFYSDAPWDEQSLVSPACPLLVSLWVVLSAITGRAPGHRGAALLRMCPAPPLTLTSDLVFCLSRAIRPRLKARLYFP